MKKYAPLIVLGVLTLTSCVSDPYRYRPSDQATHPFGAEDEIHKQLKKTGSATIIFSPKKRDAFDKAVEETERDFGIKKW